MSRTLTLYTTSGCHLCEQAKDMMWPELSRRGWQLEEVDIAEADDLMDAYGVHIPVVAMVAPGSGQAPTELGWPFDQNRFEEWLAEV